MLGVAQAPKSTASAPDWRHKASRTKAGIEMAVSLIQYCIAWTRVIERIPPMATATKTTTARTAPPIHVGQPVAWRNASPAPCTCGSR